MTYTLRFSKGDRQLRFLRLLVTLLHKLGNLSLTKMTLLFDVFITDVLSPFVIDILANVFFTGVFDFVTDVFLQIFRHRLT